MTLIENDSPKAQYTGPFIKGQLLPLTFPYIAKTDVKMLIDGVPAELNIDFEIITEVSAEHPVAYPDSAYLKNALPTAKQITLYRVTPLDQQAPFPQNSKFRSERIEQALDKLTMQQQEQRETIARCMKAPITTKEFDGSIPSPDPNKALKINSTGTGFELSEFDMDVVYRDTEIFKNQAQQAASVAEQCKNISVQQAEIAISKAEITISKAEEAKDWAISEVIVDNTDYSAKYWAGKAKDNSGIYYDELLDEDIDVEILTGEYATKSDLELGLDTKQDKGDYALRSELPNITPLATKSDLELGLDTKQDKGDYALRSEIPSITHLATKTEVNAKQDKGDYATRTELNEGLDTKQAKGNYALKSDLNSLATKSELPTQVSELENDSNYATQTQVLQAIASIPQFSLSIVNELPATGEKMTLYLVPKEGTNNDVYDEYIWIEQTSSFEHLGTTAVDLTDYVKNTDYATDTVGGVVKISGNYFGLAFNGSKQLYINKALDTEVTAKASHYKPIVPSNLDLAVKTGVTTNTIELTDDEKASARTWIGAIGNADYATASKAGVLTPSSYYATAMSGQYLYTQNKTLDQYKESVNGIFIGKGTLENIKNDLVKRAVTENDIELTDDEKTSARTWLGAISATDYAGATTGGAGVVKCSSTFACGCVNGYIQAMNIPTLERYNNLSQYAFIGKATLETALTQYSKTVLTTEADYNALTTKDANTLYLIEE